MSIDLNWETLTTGPDGEALALRIRDFIHTKFQAVPLPRFIKSVKVHDFEFGAIAPELELKDITDPLPDFYEENPDIEDDEEEDEDVPEPTPPTPQQVPSELRAAERRRQMEDISVPPRLRTHPLRGQSGDFPSPFLGVSTPGILGGTSNLHYFQSHLGTGWSGTQTPLAAVAGAHMGNRLDTSAVVSPVSSPLLNGYSPSHSRHASLSSISPSDFNPAAFAQQQQLQDLREKASVSTLAPTSAGASRPPTRDTHVPADSAPIQEEEDEEQDENAPRFREPRPEDLQAVFRIRYAGDVRLRLTAEILLDYPMPSFVGIPVQLSVTGLTFDGIGVMAHIRKRVHFCFLNPEDAATAVGVDEAGPTEPGKRFGGLLQEIQVESEIGLRDGGKQSLKNVGKVERFVLEQVRRIFENEFVYPSFWTFLV
ncbi:Mitochondrial distribution and morphology protein 12 [Colletotrichum siamense]|nr:Mitochondrial distribution and morphology protein 12 [Colletotrichum siamense]KAF4833212.1 Mitochondrial distribution and morphology protein 12 [Colletotrichum tropicale]KAI8168086.1 Mitochondrial distribution and morphology protein 12 [Colletotrichum sp. SAR 10_65]KAI8206522.1 Mitochondrial distribution and morphology protein 12 [Colletotrichum sp. SAR 10_76]KAI8223389.1 Mitochondrial distribution and morphology protein 12 [Colletotrichum sp. SAR 10_86]KAI8255537.1 Mitochondrial distributi